MAEVNETSRLLGNSSTQSASNIPLSAPAEKNFYFVNNRKKSQNDDASTEGGANGANDDNATSAQPPSTGSWLSNLFTPNAFRNVAHKPRKVPVKVEPKVFFANERTFLAWLHMSVILSTISLAIIAFADANELSQIYGLLLMPVAIGFCCYSLWMYMKRAAMIRRKDPGPYEDKFGPVVLAALLALSIVVNFAVKLYELAT